MSTHASPRVNVVVTPDQHRYLMTLARHQNRSAASLVRAMIDAAEPLMKRTVELLDLTEEAQGLTRQTAIDAIKAVLDEMRELAGDGDQFQLPDLLPGEPDEAAAARAPSGARAHDAAPPSSNTGVSSAGPTARKAAR